MNQLRWHFVLLSALAVTASSQGQAPSALRIGSTSSLTGISDSAQEKAGKETLRRFIKDETGLDNDIAACEPWQSVAADLAKGDLQFGTFQGYEFAWAVEKYPALRPLAVGVNVHRYPVTCVVVKRDNPAATFADLKGQTLVLPRAIQPSAPLFIDRSAEQLGQKTDAFFKEVKSIDNIEDALDEVFEGKSQATVIDEAALDAYKRRKPGRYKQLKEVARSRPFPPVVIAYKESAIDPQTLQRFRATLLSAAKKEKGEMLLTLSRLTGFEPPAADLNGVLAESRKNYPAK